MASNDASPDWAADSQLPLAGARSTHYPRSSMQPVEARFRFRFESGPRENEWISLEEGTNSVGRLPKNDVQIADPSVSGKHAELRVNADGVTLVDLGSTNGTKVEGERIESLPLGHGDQIHFGSVKASFHDAQMGGAPTLEEPGASAPAQASPGGLGMAAATGADSSRVSADALERSSKGSKTGLLVLLLLIVVGGGAFAYLYLQKQSAGGGTQAAPIQQVDGNLLGDYSFEGDNQWNDADGASQPFFVDRSFALSGSVGFGALLEGEDWALASSEMLSLSSGKSLQLSGFVSARSGALGRLGIELIQSEADSPSVIAWAPASAAADFTETSLNFVVPAGIKSARVLVAAKGASGESEVSFDDLSLVPGEGAGTPALRYEEYELSLLGEGASSAILSRSGRILFTGISTSAWGYAGLAGAADAGWSAKATSNGFELTLSAAASAGTRCEFLANGARPLSPNESSSPYIASMGQGGYRTHALGFKREGATHLLAGGGANLMRFSTGKETSLSASNRAGQPVLSLGMAGSRTLGLQLGFDQERGLAESLALKARLAGSDQRAGDALSAWSKLLNTYPIDAGLIAEAEGARARMLGEGHARIDELTLGLGAADFFQLRDGYARCRSDAQALGKNYKGSEIETKAKALVERIDASLEGLASDGQVEDAELLGGVLSSLDAAAEPELSARLKQALADHKQDDDPRK